jgi:hypothetical protein
VLLNSDLGRLAPINGVEPKNHALDHKLVAEPIAEKACQFLFGHVSLNGWWARRDSNPHLLRDQNLNLARLPISPLARGM